MGRQCGLLREPSPAFIRDGVRPNYMMRIDDDVELSGFGPSVTLIFCGLTGIAVVTYIGGLLRDTVAGNAIAPAIDFLFLLFVYLPLVTVGLVITEPFGIDPPSSEPLGTALVITLLLAIYYIVSVISVNGYRVSVSLYTNVSDRRDQDK